MPRSANPPLKFTDLQFPLGGLHRRLDLQRQPPYTSHDLLNVWPDQETAVVAGDALGRMSGGTRPALVNAFGQQISGSANSVLLLTDLIWLNAGTLTTTLFASAGGKLWRESGTNMVDIANYSGLTLASSRQLCAADYNQKLYITGDSASWRILVYDPTTDTLSLHAATAGSLPSAGGAKCTLVARFRGRLVFSGDLANPLLWYMTAVNAPGDFDYNATGSGGAVSATSSSQANTLSDPVTALIPHNDDCLIFGCSDSLQILRGDPKLGGMFSRLSSRIGVLSGQSWCYDPEGYLWFMSRDGLYVMSPGCGTVPQRVSREKMPAELLNIDPSAYTISMAYDLRFCGVHLCVTKNTTSAVQTHWFIKIDKSMGGVRFFPVQFADRTQATSYNMDPTFAYSRRNYVPAAYRNEVIFGGRDGYLRQYKSQGDSTNLDGGITGSYFNSYYYVGPFPLAQPGYDGILSEMQIRRGSNSGDIVVTIKTGDSADGAVDGNVNSESYEFTGTGLNQTIHPRLRGAFAVIKVEAKQSSGLLPWRNIDVEEMIIRRSLAGRRRING